MKQTCSQPKELTLRNSRCRKSFENQVRSYSFVRDIYIYKGKLHLLECLPLLTSEEEDD